MNRIFCNIVSLLLLLLMVGAAQAQVDEGVTSSGKEVDCSTIDPSVDNTVNESGKIVTSPRVTRNGKLITTECAEDILVEITGADSKEFCAGGSVNVVYTASHPSLTGTGISYKWYVNDVLKSETGATFTATFSANGDYVVRCDVSQGTASGSGSKTTSVSVITPLTGTLAVSANPTTIYAGGSSTLTASVTGTTAGTLTYQWYSGSSAISGATGTTYSASPAATTTYKCIETATLKGCTATNEKSVKVTVSEPTLTVTSVPNSASIGLCSASSVEITYTADYSGPTPTSYSWSVTGGSISGASNTSAVTVIVSSTGTVTASCTVNYSGGSKNASKSTTVTSGGQPANMVLYEDYNAHSIQITSTDCITSTLVWKNSSGEVVLTNSDQIPSYLGVTLPSGIYTVTGSNSSGCSITKSAVLGLTNTSSCYASALQSNEVGSGHTLTAVKDHQNNQYAVFTIAGYCMTKQNMRCTTSPTGQSFTSNSGYTYEHSYYYLSSLVGNVHGYLYNWHAALDLPDGLNTNSSTSYTNRRGICPEGWHVPSWPEWENIIHLHDAGQFVLSNSESPFPWWEAYTDACQYGPCDHQNVPGNPTDPDKNASGFSAVPAGYFYNNAVEPGGNAYFWSSTTGDYGENYAGKVADLARDQGVFYNLWFNKPVGYSVRCIRDY